MGGGYFIGCMFIGMGIGMIFDNAGAGTIIGMGVGFIVESIFGDKKYSVKHIDTISRRLFSSIISLVIGIGFILGGLWLAGLLVVPEIYFKYLGSIFLVLIGLAILLKGVRRVCEKSNE